VEGKDFVINAESGEYRKPLTKYHLTHSMAKELSMIERNDKGQEVR
jgi:phage anti-repressor protein